MKKALLCIGNGLRGDDGIALYLGKLVEKELKDWKVFYGEDVPENEFESIRNFAPDILVVADAISGFKEGVSEFLDISDEKTYMYSTHNLPTPVLLSYLRTICLKTIFLGISVLLENVLDFKEGLSKNALQSANLALDKIKLLDKELK
ncbi:hydrogenase maturation protease [Campylobacter sputorum]|uniref:hydrogenase maturation protease n=1 Tax=Campylobacter sputorum TaxID=206 RepID=UPI001E3EA610|nr:hydrogenase maturation protease [Campylobacter sputorum]